MRVFVLSTGRAGTKTFTQACQHIENFTAAHETPISLTRPLHFPDQHIEINPHLTWLLGPLRNKVEEDDFFVFLKRNQRGVVSSWMKRRRTLGPGLWIPLSLRDHDATTMTAEDYKTACNLCYTSMVYSIHKFLEDIPNPSMTIILRPDTNTWKRFWDRIGAQGDFEKSLMEWTIHYD